MSQFSRRYSPSTSILHISAPLPSLPRFLFHRCRNARLAVTRNHRLPIHSTSSLNRLLLLAMGTAYPLSGPSNHRPPRRPWFYPASWSTVVPGVSVDCSLSDLACQVLDWRIDAADLPRKLTLYKSPELLIIFTMNIVSHCLSL